MDRGKPGSKMHILSDAAGLPLRVGLSAANTHDSLALKPMHIDTRLTVSASISSARAAASAAHDPRRTFLGSRTWFAH